jgi:hypothetical protein
VNFQVEGPYTLQRFGQLHEIITNQSKQTLKKTLDDEGRGLSIARGCYVFAIKAASGYTPYYVGQANKQSILAEALSPPKLTIYNEVCSNTNGTPVLFFLPMITPNGKYCKTTVRRRSITFLERWLIAQALGKNPNLYNTSETQFLRKLHVVGVFNATQGESTTQSRALTKALGFRKIKQK